MDDEQIVETDPEQEKRSSVLFVFYLLMICGTFFVFLFAICGGIIIYMAASIAGIAAFALVHWWLWGSSFTRSLATEQHDEGPPPAPEAVEDDPYRGRY